MPIALLTGPANAGKARLVLEAIRAHAAHWEHPLLVVPTEADQARYRRELAEGGLALGVRVERFEGLLGEVLVRAGESIAPLSALARERLLARIAGVRPGTASELAALVADLETQRVTPARLRGALRAWGSGGQPTTLEWICDALERYQSTLTRMRRADRELRVTSALDALRRRPALWRATPVALYGFDDFTELQLDTIETLGGIVEARVTVSLPCEPGRVVFAGRATTFQRLRPLADTHTELAARADYYAQPAREALHHLERSLLAGLPTRVDHGDAVRLLEGGSPRAELELVAGEVRALLDEGVQADEIAIAHRSPAAIAALIGEVFVDFDIPYGLRTHVMFARTAVGRGLLGMLRCALGGGELGDLLAWLRAPGVLERPDLADRLERSARRQGALDAARARSLWEAERWPLDRLDRLSEAAKQGLVVLADVLAAELGRLFSAPRTAAAAVLEDYELDEAHALVGARRVLEELRELARSVPELAPTPSDLIEVLELLELSVPVHPGRPREGRVEIVDPLSLRARRVRMVFACGLGEGIFPAPSTPRPLFADEDRRGLAAATGLVLRGEPDVLAAERYLLYALCSRPRERLTLSWHSADEDGTPLARSLFVDDVCDLFSTTLAERTGRRFAGAVNWPGPGRPAGSMAARVRAAPEQAAVRATVRATGGGPGGVAAVSAGVDDRGPDGVKPAGMGSHGVRPGPIQALGDERVLAELRARARWSASSLEAWTSCPVKWFVERVLRAEEIDPRPEPIARGGLAHAALKSAFEGMRERTGSARLTPASLGLAKRLLREALVEHEPLYPLSAAPERVPGARRRLAVDLERYLEYAAEQASPLEPTHLELEFGFDEDGLGPLDLGDGVSLRGRIDRVDVGGEQAIVYDYKGRLAPAGARWVSDGAFQIALYMRAVQQLLGLEPAGGFYQPLTGREIKARGVLAADSGLELDCVRTDRLDREALDELIEQCAALARKAAAEARS
ncbi:MAG TPA: PD-(D/E)XK nuclease family protein, partial [Solirubrobacteraceae bacterium]|nr:PD-(D/E)XK nuclease family protein [Solirubrobacteraceae bacterium]